MSIVKIEQPQQRSTSRRFSWKQLRSLRFLKRVVTTGYIIYRTVRFLVEIANWFSG